MPRLALPSPDPRNAWVSEATTVFNLWHLAILHLYFQISTNLPVNPRNLEAHRPAPELHLPPHLEELHDRVDAQIRWWKLYAEMHYRTPEEIAVDNWHWQTEYRFWPGMTPTGKRGQQYPYRRIPRRNGWVRVAWFKEVADTMGHDFRRHPEMYEHLQLEPDGSLKIGALRRKWNMENMFFVEWNPKRWSLWPSVDGETLRPVSVRHLMNTGEQWPILRVIEQPSLDRQAIRYQRSWLMTHCAPWHLRIYLRWRNRYFYLCKHYFKVKRYFYPWPYVPKCEASARRFVAGVIFAGFLATLLVTFAFTWAVKVYVVPPTLQWYAVSNSKKVVDVVVASGLERRAWLQQQEWVQKMDGWAQRAGEWVQKAGQWAQKTWAHTLPMLVLRVVTSPAWVPLWLIKTVVVGLLWAVRLSFFALFWMATDGLKKGTLGVLSMV